MGTMGRRVVYVTIAVVALAGCSDASERDSTATEPAGEARGPRAVDSSARASGAGAWTGLVHDRGVVVHRMTPDAAAGVLGWNDPRDAPMGSADVLRVSLSPEGQAHWRLELAERPPPVADMEAGLVIAYGLVIDTNGDAAADHLIGIDDDAPRAGDLRVWVTDLATGETDQRLGAPYGYPIEFSHPGEPEPRPDPPTMVFTFLGRSKPADLDPRTAHFYAWASATRDGRVVAYDTAPDTGWITAGQR
jgi:hypothetical protein